MILHLLCRKTVITGNTAALPINIAVPPDTIARHHLPPTLHRPPILRRTSGRKNLDELDVLVVPIMIHRVTAPVPVLVPAPVPVPVPVPAPAITRFGTPLCP